MNDFNYFELIASFYYGIFDQIRQGISIDMSVNQSLDDFWLYPEYDNRLPNLVVLVQYLHIKYSFNKSFTKTQIEIYKNQIELIKNDDLCIWLSSDELNHLNETIKALNSTIENNLS